MKKMLVLIMVALISGCATTSNWTPTVDSTVDPKAAQLTNDIKDCKVLAEKAAGTFVSIAENTVVTSMVGAATGAAIGSAFASPQIGASVGAASGILGGLYGAFDSDRVFKNAYKACLRGRNHPVL